MIKTTIIKKLLYFIIPLLTIPIILMILFSYKYLTHIIENEVVDLTKTEINHIHQVLEKTYHPNINFQDYLDENKKKDTILIVDKNLYIISSEKKEFIGKVCTLHTKFLKKHIINILKTKETSFYHDKESMTMVKPIVDKKGEMVAFSIGHYEDVLQQKIGLINQTFLFTLLVVIFVIFIIIIITIVFAFNITNPIQELITGTQTIASGDLSYHIPTTSDDEIGVLVNSFNSMVEKLKETQEELKRESSSKSSFLANMSHEIRTPMNAIVGFINILMKNETSQEKIKKLKIIKESSHTLLDIINDILDFSKIESGKLEIEEHLYETRAPFLLATELFQEKAQEKNITININTDSNLPLNAYGDSTRIKQVFINILSNALKFSTQNSSIDIDLLYDEKTKRFICSVTDKGKGIKPENIEKIFSAFSQEDSSITRSFGGTGLGLSICKMLIEFMNGTLEVESELGKGSKFTFSVDIFSNVPEIEMKEELDEESPVVTFKGKVLIVEDNKTNQLLLRLLLEEYDLEVVIANDGIEGIQAYKNEQFSLIMMDENMPNMNGMESSKQIKILEKQKSYITPIVAVTANALKEDKKRFLDAGMDDYLAKPIDDEELLRVLSRFLG